MQELDLSKPGKLWVAVENEATSTFHLVVPNPKYTREGLTRDPTISPADALMTPFTVPASSVDSEGVANLDLGATGRGAEVMARLSERYDRGEKKVETVRAIVIATARAGNKIPDKQVAEVMDFKLLPIPSLRLKGVTSYLTAQNYKAGQQDFVAELTVTGPIEEVILTAAPSAQIKVAGGPTGNGTVKLPVREGSKYTIQVAAPFKKRTESRMQMVPRTYVRYVPGGWRTAGGRVELDPATYTREIWDGGFIALKATGTGRFAGISQAVNNTAEAWGAAWLLTQPPPPFYHNVC